MIVTYLQGGLANQMHQYATGLALATRRRTELRLNVDSFQKDVMRRYSLCLWKGVTEGFQLGLEHPIVYEQGMPYNPKVLEQAPESCTIRGYWQTEKYYQDIRHTLVERFMPKYPVTSQALKTQSEILVEGDKSVFLTIRRTDYVGNNFHGLLSMEYYDEALRIVASKFPDPHVFVFSDEPDWVGENFQIPYRWTLAGNFDRTTKDHLGREDEELWLMSQCRNAVMANSSYSFWGAWLAPFEGQVQRVVVAPKQWFGPTSNEDPKDIVPERWITI